MTGLRSINQFRATEDRLPFSRTPTITELLQPGACVGLFFRSDAVVGERVAPRVGVFVRYVAVIVGALRCTIMQLALGIGTKPH